MAKQSNVLVLLTGDFNLTTTGFQEKYITQANHLKQLVTFKTWDSGTLDWLFTDRPNLFTVSQLPKVGFSDHHTILAKPATAPSPKYTINKIMTRDLRDSAWRPFGRWLTQKDWSAILGASSCEEKLRPLCQNFPRALACFFSSELPKNTQQTVLGSLIKSKCGSVSVKLHLFSKGRTQWLTDSGEIRCSAL